MLVKVNGVVNHVVDSVSNQTQLSNNHSFNEIHSSLDGLVQGIYHHSNLSNSYDIHIKLSDGSKLIVENMDLPMVKVGDFVHQGDLLGHANGFASEIIKKLDGHYLSVEQFNSVSHAIPKHVDNSGYEWDLDGYAYNNGIPNNETNVDDLKNAMDYLTGRTNVVPADSDLYSSNNPFTIIADFIQNIQHEGVWYACTGQHFGSWILDKGASIGNWLLHGMLNLNDLVFLFPAMALTFGVIMFGRHKYTKFILPAWGLYAITELSNKILYG